MKIEIHKAVGHGFAFFADSLNYWNAKTEEEDQGWIFAATVERDMNQELTLDLAMKLADEMFERQNAPWFSTPWFTEQDTTLTDFTPDEFIHFGAPAIECAKKRSLSVADVLVIEHAGDRFILGCDTMGWKEIGDE